MLQSLFSKAPIEADDLAVVLEAIRTGSQQPAPDGLGKEEVGEYLRQLLRTRTAETQFSMLSSSEKKVIGELLDLVPRESSGELRDRFRSILGA